MIGWQTGLISSKTTKKTEILWNVLKRLDKELPQSSSNYDVKSQVHTFCGDVSFQIILLNTKTVSESYDHNICSVQRYGQNVFELVDFKFLYFINSLLFL